MPYMNPTSRPSFKRGASALLVAILIGLIAGCSAAPPMPSEGPTPSATPSAPLPATPSPSTSDAQTRVPSKATGWMQVPPQPSVSGTQFLRVVWTGSRFVATGSPIDANGGVILDSSDGLTWNRQTIQAADQMPMALAAGPRGVVAVGSMDDHVTAWSSSDGLTWTVRRDAFPAPTAMAGPAATTFTVQGLVATDDGWLAVGREDPVCQLNCGTDPIRPLIWTSTDGLAWTWLAGSAGLGRGGMDSVTRTATGYVAVGLGKARAAAWTSTDGRAWTTVADNPAFHPRSGANPAGWIEMLGVAADRGVIVAAGIEGPSGNDAPSVRAWWSIDGRTWSRATGQGFLTGQVFSVTTTPVGFVATGPSGSESCLGGIWESTDGRSWSCAASEPPFAGFGPYAAAASPSIVVAVGLHSGGPDTDAGLPGEVWVKQLQ